MKRGGSIFFVLLFMVSSPAFGQEKEIKMLSNETAFWMVKSGSVSKVAVVDFLTLQDSATELGRFLAEELSFNLAQINQYGKIDFQGKVLIPGKDRNSFFDVIDRTHLATLLKEHQLSMTGIVDPTKTRKIGEVSGVDALVTGTITTFSDKVSVTVKVLDTQTAKIVCSAKTELPLTSSVRSILTPTDAPIPPPGQPTISTSAKPLAKKPNDQDWKNGPRRAIITTRDRKIILTKINFVVIPLKLSGGDAQINSSEILSLKVEEDLPPNQCKVTVTRWDGKTISGIMTKSAIWGEAEFGKWTGRFGLSPADGGVHQMDIIHEGN
jgi:TolB-like protein